MSQNSFALLVLVLFAVAVPTSIVVLSAWAGRPKRRTTDVTPYECGAKPFESARRPFSTKFYVIAMLFILFDVEAAFLYPWAAAVKDRARAGNAGFVLGSMLVFLGVLAAGYVYVWGRGALDWDR